MHLLIARVNDIVRFPIPVWDKMLRTVAVYALVYILLRIFRRDAAQLTASDFVVLLLLSNVVQNAVIGPDNSLVGGAIGAVTLVAVNEIVARSEKRLRERRGARGAHEDDGSLADHRSRPNANLLIHDGRFVTSALRHYGVSVEDLEVELRRQGVEQTSDVQDAWLHLGGAIEVELRRDARGATYADARRIERKLDELLAAR